MLFVRNEGSLNSSSMSPVRLVDNQNEKGRIRRLHARQAGPLVSLDFSVVFCLVGFCFHCVFWFVVSETHCASVLQEVDLFHLGQIVHVDPAYLHSIFIFRCVF